MMAIPWNFFFDSENLEINLGYSSHKPIVDILLDPVPSWQGTTQHSSIVKVLVVGEVPSCLHHPLTRYGRLDPQLQAFPPLLSQPRSPLTPSAALSGWIIRLAVLQSLPLGNLRPSYAALLRIQHHSICSRSNLGRPVVREKGEHCHRTLKSCRQ